MSKRNILINKKNEFDFEQKDKNKSYVIGFLSKIYPRDNSVKVVDEIRTKNTEARDYFNQVVR